MHSTTPAFNLKVVLKETGIAADTLRAWERRYGLPVPQRTPGGHRLYSQRDIETIKWLMARQAEGLSISRAVDLWNEQIASGSDPLAGAAKTEILPASATNLESLRRDWLAACFRYDTMEAEHILNQAFAANSVEIVCTDVILRGLYEVGEYWHKGQASVQQEHFASGIATRRLESLIGATPPPVREETVILACPPDEWHVFPLLLINLFLRRRGWNVIHLGASVPVDQMEETIKTTKPSLVILSAQTLTTAVHLREMARALNKIGIQAAFGGRVFNNINGLPARIPAHFLANTIQFAVPAIESLLASPRPAPKEEPISQSARSAAAAFAQKRAQVENALSDALAARGQPIAFLDTANRFLGDNLTAALELGDVSFLSTDMAWIAHLLIGHNVPPIILPIYLDVYAHAVDQVLNGGGKIISDWLKLQAAGLKIV